jgi:hypothetical protein
LIGNDENCTQGYFYDATVSKMAANKIDKFLMVSDFNENWYLRVFWSEELVDNDERMSMIRVDFGPISETVYIDIISNTIIER